MVIDRARRLQLKEIKMFKVIKKFAMFASIGTLALAPLALIATPASASPGRVAIGVLSCPRGGQLEYGGNQCGEFSAGVGKSYPAAFRFLRYVGHSKAGKR